MKLFLKWLVFVLAPRWFIVILRSDIPRRPSEDPAQHTEYEIAWALQDGWKDLVNEHVAASAGRITPREVTALRRTRISVAFVEKGPQNEAVGFVRPNTSPQRLPDAALGLLMGVPAEAARAVDQRLRDNNPGLISKMHVLVRCHFREGRWRPLVVDLDEPASDADR